MQVISRILGAAWVVFLGVGSASAQETASDLRKPAQSSYDVVALRVEFQPDTTRFTTGNGTFDGSVFDTLSVSIDPLPHDADYFRAHLAFLEDYVGRVSDGQTAVRSHLIPEVVRLPHRMGHYSPTGPEADSPAEQEKLARLVRDAWSEADRWSDFDMSRFDPENTALVLFHAGAGRDIELVGTSLTNTPEDIPSLYLDLENGSGLGGGLPSFNGFPVRHSMILPETESRQGTNPLTQNPFIAEFSLNGMLAATFFNYLDVPDLFNTETGETAIGPFGLMDPLGIFAYNGLFPPEPTAWTKYYLGWIDPPELPLSESTDISLTAVADTSSSDAVLVRISEGEYFLLENRHRDPRGDGLHLKVWRNGAFTTQEIAAGTDDFSRFDPAAFMGGVVAGVDAYDWAVPGGTTEEGEIMYGGIAVWHIDERKVAEGLAANTINNDPRRRGIDLEEADGAQDLGFTAETVFGTGSEQGTPFDLFFRGNPVRVVTDRGETVRLYENRFGPDTRPSTANAGGGPSFIEISNFSESAREMTAEVGLTPAAEMQTIRVWRGTRLSARFGTGSAVTARATPSDTTLYFLPGNERDSIYRAPLSLSDPSEIGPWGRAAGFKPVQFGPHVVTLTTDGESGRWTLQIGDSTSVDLPSSNGDPVGAPVVVASEGGPVLYVAVRGENGASLVRWDGGEDVEVITDSVPPQISTLAAAGGGRLALIGQRETLIRGGTTRWSYDVSGSDGLVGAAFGRDRNGLMGVLADTTAGELVILQPDGTTTRIGREKLLGSSSPTSPVVSDLDGDGMLDILVAAGSRLVAFTRTGAAVEGFPVATPAPVVSQPLVVRFGDDRPWSVLAGATDGYIYAYEVRSSRQPDERFPLAVGRSMRATPWIDGETLVAVGRSGGVHAWRFARVDSVAWGQLHADVHNRGFVEVAGDASPPPTAGSGSGLLSRERTYNWPNPVREGRTNLRMVVNERCDVQITIVDMAGTLVEQISVDDVPANVPYETTWETDVPSGVYYARLKATAGSGRTDTKLITIAVVN